MQWIPAIGFGSGKNGSPAVSGTINSYATCTGTATQYSLTTTLSASLGDVILIHQSQGTGAGQWEINYVLADAGATLTLAYPLAYTYGTGAQAVLVPQYTGGTLSGAVTCSAWDGSKGGTIALISSGDLVITGSLSVAASGFRGGLSAIGGGNSAQYGDGHTGNRGTSTGNTRNGNGGSGFFWTSSGDGAGGHAAIGGTVGSGQGGINVGQANLQTVFFGGGGGGGYKGAGSMDPGGNGGGFILIIAKSIDTSGATILSANGGVGGNSEVGGQVASGGAGGSILIKCQKAVLGTNKLTATGGAGGTIPVNGGAGSVGRIHIDYLTSYTGSTSPTIDATQDTNLQTISGGNFLTNFL